MDYLSGDSLFKTVQGLADDIGPRPPGSPQEEQARQYLTEELTNIGITDIERINFPTIDTWGWGMIVPITLAWIGAVFGYFNKFMGLIGSLLTLAGAYNFWTLLNSNVEKQWFYPFYKKSPGGTLIARIPAQEEHRHKVVLIGHTDTNKNRASFSKFGRQSLLIAPISLLAATLINSLASLMKWKKIHRLTEMYMMFGLTILIVDEMEEFVDGANDNASAVASVLGIGKHVKENPLKHTDVWLAFTGSEEVGLVGLNALLDKYGDELRDAYFIDFELVGAGKIVYVSEHSGFSPFSSYKPDNDSVQLAEATMKTHPELGVKGQDVTINEEISTLRQRGYRGICLVGVDDEGWLINWHRLTDTSHYIKPESLETAARFAYGMIEELDKTIE